MAADRNAVKVGIVTLVVLGLFFAILMWISQRVDGDLRTITIRFPATSAMPPLAEGSQVYVGGQQVGRVTGAELKRETVQQEADVTTAMPATAGDAYFVYVTAEVLSFVEFRTDCQAVPAAPPLGGSGTITIDVGAAAGKIGPNDVINGAAPGGLNAILASLQGEIDASNPDGLLGRIKHQLDPDAELSLLAKILQSVSDINTITESLSKELAGDEKERLLAKFHAIFDDVNATTSSLRREFDGGDQTMLLGKVHVAMNALGAGLETIERVLRNGEGPITRTLENVERTSASIATETDAQNLDSLMAQFKMGATKINQSIDDLNTVTGTARTVVVLNRENINKLLQNFKEASDHLTTGIKFVLLHPWRVFNEPKPDEIKEQAIFDAARSFAEAATRLDDAAAHLRALSELHNGSIPTDDPDLIRLQDDLKRTRDSYVKAEAELWERLGVK